MKPDKTTKILLAFIASGLWLNVIAPMFRPAKVAADTTQIEHDIHSIEHDLHTIYSGICLNAKICGS
jgi:hypothetical protein